MAAESQKKTILEVLFCAIFAIFVGCSCNCNLKGHWDQPSQVNLELALQQWLAWMLLWCLVLWDPGSRWILDLKVECLDGPIYRLLHSVWLRLLRHSEGYRPGPEAECWPKSAGHAYARYYVIYCTVIRNIILQLYTIILLLSSLLLLLLFIIIIINIYMYDYWILFFGYDSDNIYI